MDKYDFAVESEAFYKINTQLKCEFTGKCGSGKTVLIAPFDHERNPEFISMEYLVEKIKSEQYTLLES